MLKITVKGFVAVENRFLLSEIHVTTSARNMTILEAKITIFNYHFIMESVEEYE